MFTTLDLASGCWQVEWDDGIIKKEDGFSTFAGFISSKWCSLASRMPPTFQHLMECLLAGLSPAQCLSYLNDIIIYGTSCGSVQPLCMDNTTILWQGQPHNSERPRREINSHSHVRHVLCKQCRVFAADFYHRMFAYTVIWEINATVLLML